MQYAVKTCYCGKPQQTQTISVLLSCPLEDMFLLSVHGAAKLKSDTVNETNRGYSVYSLFSLCSCCIVYMLPVN